MWRKPVSRSSLHLLITCRTAQQPARLMSAAAAEFAQAAIGSAGLPHSRPQIDVPQPGDPDGLRCELSSNCNSVRQGRVELNSDPLNRDRRARQCLVGQFQRNKSENLPAVLRHIRQRFAVEVLIPECRLHRPLMEVRFVPRDESLLVLKPCEYHVRTIAGSA